MNFSILVYVIYFCDGKAEFSAAIIPVFSGHDIQIQFNIFFWMIINAFWCDFW